MCNVFWHYRTNEWNGFIATVSDWDIKNFLDVPPLALGRAPEAWAKNYPW